MIVGSGLLPALNAFASVPTAFVNGLYMDVTAHALATNYALSGRMSLSQSRDFPCLAALMGKSSGTFPAHVVLGGTAPLGDSSLTSPPVISLDIDGIRGMMSEPGKNAGWSSEALSNNRQLLSGLNDLQRLNASSSRRGFFERWVTMQTHLQGLYAKNLEQYLGKDPDREVRYGVKSNRDNPSMILGAYQLLRSGLSPYQTILLNGFDTHNQELLQQKPLQEEFATSLQAFIDDLRQTPDPLRPDLSLIDTTTILIGSEFVRTPKFNGNQGTDHWKSASAIVMGKGVRDNKVLGKTDSKAQALGWVDDQAVPRSNATNFLQEHLASAILGKLGFPDAQSTLGHGGVNGLFI